MDNGDKSLKLSIGSQEVCGLGSFHKTLPHNEFGEVSPEAFQTFVTATNVRRAHNPTVDVFANIPRGVDPISVDPDYGSAPLVNPLAGLALDGLTPSPETFTMPPAPSVQSLGTAAEMVELYWMALLRDLPFDQFKTSSTVGIAVSEIDSVFSQAKTDTGDDGVLKEGTDLTSSVTRENVFRAGLPGEEAGPLVSQFFVRDARFGTQTIDQRQLPYRRGLDFLTTFPEWLNAQRRGRGVDGAGYPNSNERRPDLYYDPQPRYISCMRDLARFVNKDALHQAYFNAALLLLDGQARWTPGNPYVLNSRRDAGFGTLGGPHILALVSEVATRALKVVWFQKWQVNLRLRPEAYAGHLHVQEVGVPTSAGLSTKRAYGLKATGAFGASARSRIQLAHNDALLLPMAFTAGSPIHPAYGAGHATVAGACVTILKAYFDLLETPDKPRPITELVNFPTYLTGIDASGNGTRVPVDATGMTIEGELNKLAGNVAMGRCMGGVHWRSDNTRSLVLGEAVAAHLLAQISTDLVEHPTFTFRTFARDASGKPATVKIVDGKVFVNDALKPLVNGDGTSLSSLLA